ncbi:hypothetical protein G6F31_018227 [Rhizopus arrhizus]|nr:hypothetical protein G6F31_018227 [Rhizopus arrhizus]
MPGWKLKPLGRPRLATRHRVATAAEVQGIPGAQYPRHALRIVGVVQRRRGDAGQARQEVLLQRHVLRGAGHHRRHRIRLHDQLPVSDGIRRVVLVAARKAGHARRAAVMDEGDG